MWTDTPWEDIPSSLTVHGLPRVHWGSHLHNYDWSVVQNADAKRDMVLQFMDAHEAGECPHLLLLGREGTGKTHLAVGLVRWAVYQTDLSRARFVHVPTFSHELKRTFGARGRGEAVDDPFEELARTNLLALDDPFGRAPTDWELDQVIPRLVDEAYMRGASLVVSANQDLDDFRARLRRHEVSRILEGATRIGFFQDDDYRQRRGK